MILRELYIDGKLVDLDDSVKINRVYTSPFFSDVTKIMNNTTYPIKLPKTAVNAAIMEQIDREDSDSNYPYVLHSADYYVNSREVFTGAEVKVTGPFEIQCVYGANRTQYAELFTKQLNEIIPSNPSEWVSQWNIETMYNVTGKKFKYPYYVGVERVSDAPVINGVVQPPYAPPEPYGYHGKAMAQHPFVLFSDIIDLINADIDFTELKKRTNKKGLLLGGRKSNNTFEATVNYVNTSIVVASDKKFKLFIPGTSFVLFAFNDFLEKEAFNDGLDKYNLSLNFDFAISSSAGDITLDLFDSGLQFVEKITLPKLEGTFSDIYSYTLDIDAETRDINRIEFKTQNSGTFFMNGTLKMTLKNKDAIYSFVGGAGFETRNFGTYRIIDNLPKVKCIDFLSEMMKLSGLSLGANTNNKLKTFSLESFKTRLLNGDIDDWTGLISSVQKTDYKFNSNAQKNYIKYDNSDKLQFKAKESINVSDATINAEKDLYKINFDLPNVGENGIVEHILYKQRVTANGTERTFENNYTEKPNAICQYIDNGANVLRLLSCLPNDSTFGYNPYIDGENNNGNIINYVINVSPLSKNTASISLSYTDEKYFFAEAGVKVKTIGSTTYDDLFVKSRDANVITFSKDIFTAPFTGEVLMEIYHDVQGFVSSYYSIYQKLVNRPRVNEVVVKLPFDKAVNIDFEKPIYVGDWGKYCLLLEIEVPDDELCTAKLLLINQTL